MLSKESIKKVCDFMLCMARNEKKIEILREKLSELEAFEPYATFRRIDRSGKNTIDANDIRLYLKDNSIYFDEETIAATFLQHYDYDSDGVLCYAE